MTWPSSTLFDYRGAVRITTFLLSFKQVPDTRDYLDTRTVTSAGRTSFAVDNEAVRPSDHFPLVVTLEVKQ